MTLAVSSSGFSSAAINKALAVGIEIRTLDDMAAEDFKDWLVAQHVALEVREWSLAELAIELYVFPPLNSPLPRKSLFRETISPPFSSENWTRKGITYRTSSLNG